MVPNVALGQVLRCLKWPCGRFCVTKIGIGAGILMPKLALEHGLWC